MKKIILTALLLASARIAFCDVGDVTVINTVSPQNNAFQYIARSTNVFVSTSAFSKNLGSADSNLQHALQTLDQLSSGGAGGSATMRYEQDGSPIVNTTTTNVVAPITVTSVGGKAQIAVDGSSVTLAGVLVAGSNITLTPSAGSTTIASTGGGAITPNSTFYVQNTLTPTTTSQVYSVQIASVSDSAYFNNVSTFSIGLTTMTFQAGTGLILQQVTANRILAVDGNGIVISTNIATGGGSTSPGGGDSNVQINHPNGTFYGDNGFQYDASASSVTLGGQFGLITGNNNILLQNVSGDPAVVIDNASGSPDENIFFRSFGTNTARLRAGTGTFQIYNSTGNLLTPIPLLSFQTTKTNFINSAGQTVFALDYVGNSTFTIPVAISTLTVSRQIIDSSGSVGTNNQVLTSNGSVDTWQTPSAGAGGTSVYNATATAGFPFGFSASTAAYTGNVLIGTTTDIGVKLFIVANSTTIPLVIQDPVTTLGGTGSVDLTEWRNDFGVNISSVAKDGSFIASSSVTANVGVFNTILSNNTPGSSISLGSGVSLVQNGTTIATFNAGGNTISEKTTFSPVVSNNLFSGQSYVSIDINTGNSSDDLTFPYSLTEYKKIRSDNTNAYGYSGLRYEPGEDAKFIIAGSSFTNNDGFAPFPIGTSAPIAVNVSTASSNYGYVGIGVSTPTAQLQVGSKTNGSYYAVTVATQNSTNYYLDVSTNGHINSGGLSPSISSCGTTPNGSVVGSDNAGTITVGGGSVTSCVVTFASAYKNAPTCVLSDNSTSITGDISSISNTGFTASFSLSLGGGQIYYICIGRD